MADVATTVAAAADAIDRAASEKAVELAAPIVEGAIAAAAEQVNAADEAARQMANAFNATETGRRIGALESEIVSCKSELTALRSEMATQKTDLSSAREALSAAIAAASVVTSLSTQPKSPEVQEPATPAVAVLGAENVAVESPVPETLPARKRRWI